MVRVVKDTPFPYTHPPQMVSQEILPHLLSKYIKDDHFSTLRLPRKKSEPMSSPLNFCSSLLADTHSGVHASLQSILNTCETEAVSGSDQTLLPGLKPVSGLTPGTRYKCQSLCYDLQDFQKMPPFLSTSSPTLFPEFTLSRLYWPLDYFSRNQTFGFRAFALTVTSSWKALPTPAPAPAPIPSWLTLTHNFQVFSQVTFLSETPPGNPI